MLWCFRYASLSSALKVTVLYMVLSVCIVMVIVMSCGVTGGTEDRRGLGFVPGVGGSGGGRAGGQPRYSSLRLLVL